VNLPQKGWVIERRILIISFPKIAGDRTKQIYLELESKRLIVEEPVIGNANDLRLRLEPNPASDNVKLTFDLNKSGYTRLELYNASEIKSKLCWISILKQAFTRVIMTAASCQAVFIS